MKKALATKLLYETMASELVDKTLAVGAGLRIGFWKPGLSFQNSESLTTHSFFNTGMPVTFEITEDFEGHLELTRARPTYLWEPGFTFRSWMKKAPVSSSAQWLDGIMFNHVMPHDFQFSIVGDCPSRYRTAHMTRVHFQPLERHRPNCGCYVDPLEIENAMLNFYTATPRLVSPDPTPQQKMNGRPHGARLPLLRALVSAGMENYLNYYGTVDLVLGKLLKMGFVLVPWDCPVGHERMKDLDTMQS